MNGLPLNRRTLIKAAGISAFGSSTFNIFSQSSPNTLIKNLADSLSAKQKKAVLLPWEHKLRGFVSNNWNVVDEDKFSIGEFYSSEQQKIIHRIF